MNIETRLLYQKESGLGLDTINRIATEDGEYYECEQCSMETYHYRDNAELNAFVTWLEIKIKQLLDEKSNAK